MGWLPVYIIAAGPVAALLAWLAWSRWLARSARRVLHGSRREKSTPFAVQLGLILLPVLFLTVFALVLLKKERLAVEEDARVRAQEIADELAGRLAAGIPDALAQLQRCGALWARDGAAAGEDHVAWRGGAPRAVIATPLETETLRRCKELYPFPPEFLFPTTLALEPGGKLDDRYTGLMGLPVPSWITGSNSGSTNGPGQDSPPQTVEALRQRLRSLIAETNREVSKTRFRDFLVLATNAVEARAMTDSGLPVAVAAFAGACRAAPDAGLDETWFTALEKIILRQPSVANGWLISQGDRMAAVSGDPGAKQSMIELRARSTSLERRAQLAKALLDQGSPAEAGPRWLNDGGVWWFSNAELQSVSLGGIISIFPEAALGIAFSHAIKGEAIAPTGRPAVVPRFPAGLKASFTLENREIFLPESSWAIGLTESAAPVMSQGQGTLRRVVPSLDSSPSQTPADSLLGRYTVRIHLVDRTALFQAQRRREWLAGLLILMTAGVAGEGARQAYRAYRWQLELNEQKSNFVSSVSHELRAPLASMRLLAEGLVSGRVHDDEKRQEYAGFLLQETRRLGSLVENVLDFARIEQDRKLYEFEPVDAIRLVHQTARLMEPMAREQGVRIECMVPETQARDSTPVVGNWDGVAIQRALLNLLDNALKHSPRGSLIQVRLQASVRSRFIEISVTDQGPGIPPEEHERIFERFYRRGSELRRETKGVGLGLTIVRHIAEAHGGQVAVRSEPGKGAAFVLLLPVGGTNE